ncbi:type IV pilus twitching motility protein PilT [Desertibacillus haloalkaliphilus]|uniref:type IV pilus twitching motility protein PilT n=1 Tax=Desertibacillus haloalkaliphilus TaxID=1328930 RepID=UPI001C27673A|nr:type IV pilus twitching motility protein PilT [Desertibacillus haloalkaliphilus]MBU8905050.1 type IV pilus twitching motility protein PilT [Desertibacillus haloalkaliphilus]
MKEQVEDLLKLAFETNASDLHITVGAPPIVRINGSLKQYGKEALTPSETEAMARALIPEKHWDDFVERGEYDFSYGIPGVSRFRLNVYRQRSCISFVARVIPTKVPSLEDLQMPAVLQTLAEKPQGLILVTGPTGSGKSTTLAAMIDYINRNYSKHIITLEDPIEYLHKHQLSIINQREVGFDTEKFANGLRASLRQDPDIILVGEMRDLETISTAITAAETGHLVLATLHTSSAPQTIDRIIDVFPPHQQPQIRIQLAATLVGIVAQRLFPAADGKGRVAATEVLVNQPSVANLIRNEKNHQIKSVMQTSRAQGMHTLEMAIKQLRDQKRISADIATQYLGDGEV